MPGTGELKERIRRIEQAVAKLESQADSELRAAAKELVSLLMDFNGAGLERILEIASASGEPGKNILQQCGRDELIRSLLLLYGLHPDDLQTRVTQMLAQCQPDLRARGAEVELVGVAGGEVRLRLVRSGSGCASSLDALKAEVEDMVRDVAPDATAIVVESIPSKLEIASSFIPLSRLQASNVSVQDQAGVNRT